MNHTSAQAGYTNVPVTTQPNLPFTGFDVGLLLIVACIAIAMGVGLRQLSRLS